jgi:hypothetical protein
MNDVNKIYVCDEVRKIRELYDDIISWPYEYGSTFALINALATSHYRQYALGHPMSMIELKSWHPDCISQSYEHIISLELSQEDVQLAQARQFGYKDWQDLILKDSPLDLNFERAVDAIISGDEATLSQLLNEHTDLTQASSKYAHNAQLIHYIAANGVETHRQITPYNLPAITQQLLDHGCDPYAHHNIYDGNGTVIDLIATSAHPNDAGVAQEVIALIQSYEA